MTEVLTAIALLCGVHTTATPSTTQAVQTKCQQKLATCYYSKVPRSMTPDQKELALANCLVNLNLL